MSAALRDHDIHPVDQRIRAIYQVSTGQQWCVGSRGVTRIEACMKAGEQSYVPYIRVWAGEKCLAEICQHRLDELLFE